MAFDIELVGKIGSMALINKEYNDMDYNILARISRELKPGYIWVTSGATEIGRLDYIHRTGGELEGPDSDIKTDYAAQGQSILMSSYRMYVDGRYSVRQFLVEHQHFNDPAKRAPQGGSPQVPRPKGHTHNKLQRPRKLRRKPQDGDPGPAHQKRQGRRVHRQRRNGKPDSLPAVKPKYLLILSSVDGIYTDAKDKTTLVHNIDGATPDEVIGHIEYYQNFCDGASRKGANGARMKLEYVKEPVKLGTTVFIANSRYSIKRHTGRESALYQDFSPIIFPPANILY